MQYLKFLSPQWRRFFAGRSGSAAFSDPSAASSGASAPRRPCPVPGSEEFWLALASSYLPESAWRELEDGLRLAVRTRAYWGQTGQLWPDERPNEPPEWRRFGIHGEELRPKDAPDMRRLLVKELKRTVHTLEAPELSRLERQRRLLLHGARLGQLYAELARRFPHCASLEEMSLALAALLA